MRYIILFLVAISAIAQVDPDLAAPEQLSASDADYYNKTMIRWHALRGAHSYRIYRHSTADSANATLLGSTAAPMFLDSTATPGVTYQYWVAGESNTGIGALAGPEAGSRGVGSQNGPVGPLEPPQDPTANPTTAAKVALGKALFWDEQLSSTRTVSCASCHQPASGGIDPRSIIGDPNATNPGPDGVFGTADDITASPGVPGSLASGLYDWKAHFGITTQVTGRTSRPSFDAAYSDELFWDGRANGLEDQAAGPPVGDSEMAHTGRIWDDVVNRVIASHPLALASDIPAALASWIGDDNYPTLFGEAFGNNTVTADRVTQAIAAYERTLFSDRAPIDKARANLAPLNEAEVRGLDVFVAADCFRCHADATGSDDRYHNIGLRPTSDDPGRFGVTGN
ncbi:MAG: cytochrome c peroxidase [Rhodothermales bacterium]|jgi:cytochrome c peroxidase